MLINKIKRLQFVENKYFFYSILLINILYVFNVKFYGSIDGAAHLYNSNLIKEILLGNSFIKEFFSFNSISIPNWTSHIILTLFKFILPGWLAEKFLIIGYISGMALSFRYLVGVLNNSNKYISILIFPFIYTFLFHLGFYNFSIAFIFLFLSTAYYIKHFEFFNLTNYIVLFCFFAITYYSNILIFCFLGITIGCYILLNCFHRYKLKQKNIISFTFSKLFHLLLISLPLLILMIFFMKAMNFSSANDYVPYKDIIKYIFDVRSLIVFNYDGEKTYTRFYLITFVILFGILIFEKIRSKNYKINLTKSDFLLVPIILSGILLFITPYSSGAGMMTDRYLIIFFSFSLIWIVVRAKDNKLNIIIILFAILCHFSLQLRHMNGTLRNLDKQIKEISGANNYIKDNSIVLPVNLTNSWIQLHFSNYLGVDKPIVILENYELAVGWFPLKWKQQDFPNIQLGNRNSISNIRWQNNTNSNNSKQIDYIFFFGEIDKINKDKWHELKNIINLEFELKYISDNKFVFLYERIK